MTDRELLQMAFKAMDSVNDYSSGNGAYKGCFDLEVEILRTRLAQTECKWVDLTNDEIDDIWAEFNDGYGIIEDTLWGYERALEAKLKEKNG